MRGNKGVELEPVSKAASAWFGIDSLHGRYLFGTGEQQPVNGVVEPRQTVQISERAHIRFTAERLFVHRSCASDFLIRSAFAGNQRSMSPVNFPTPVIAEPFAVDFDEVYAIQFADLKERPIQISIDRKATEFLGGPFHLPTLHPGMDLLLEVENIGHEPRRFLAALLGMGLW